MVKKNIPRGKRNESWKQRIFYRLILAAYKRSVKNLYFSSSVFFCKYFLHNHCVVCFCFTYFFCFPSVFYDYRYCRRIRRRIWINVNYIRYRNKLRLYTRRHHSLDLVVGFFCAESPEDAKLINALHKQDASRARIIEREIKSFAMNTAKPCMKIGMNMDERVAYELAYLFALAIAKLRSILYDFGEWKGGIEEDEEDEEVRGIGRWTSWRLLAGTPRVVGLEIRRLTSADEKRSL